MADELFQKLFRQRQECIQAADEAVASATRLSRHAESGADARHYTLAAKKCERAAALYAKAGLGLLAKEQFAAASRYFCLCSEPERARLNQERWAAVSTYWEDDGRPR